MLKSVLSNRANKIKSEDNPLVASHFKCLEDAYSFNNQNGYINFGTAENHLIEEKLTTKLKSLFTDITGDQIHYNCPYGSLELREAYKFFAKEFLKIDLDTDNIAIASGTSALLEMLSFSLCDKDEKIFIPAPFYSGFLHDFQTRFHAKVITTDSYTDGVFDFNKVREFLITNKPKVFVLTNPNNPLGILHTESELKSIVSICKELKIEIIADEIYANSTYDLKHDYISLYNIAPDYKEHIHHLYGLAKDFGLSGSKVGFFHSYNKELASSIQSQCYFHTVAGTTQSSCAKLLKDKSFIIDLFKFNNSKLLENSNIIKKWAKDKDIKVIECGAGIFAYIQVSKQNLNKDEELVIYKKLFNEAKVNITPSQFFGATQLGWFRLCFAQDKNTLSIGLERISNYIINYKN